jgi:hypothetical protein
MTTMKKSVDTPGSASVHGKVTAIRLRAIQLFATFGGALARASYRIIAARLRR